MDRSFLSDEQIIQASRDFVCIRTATYEDKTEATFLKSTFLGRAGGDLRNFGFCILSPDGKRQLRRSQRGPNFVYADSKEMAADLRQVASQYSAKATGRESHPALPRMKSVRLGINVASCDGLPSVVVLGKDQGEVDRLDKKLSAVIWDEELAGRLERIAHLEALLAPADVLFQHILARHGQAVEDVAAVMSGHWGPRAPNLDRTAFAALMPEIRARSNTPIARAMDGCHETLSSGDYAGAIKLLLDWNKAVMETRGAAPWVRLGDRRRLDVRYRGNEPRLPDRDKLPKLWRNSYFIDALKNVTRQLGPTR